MQCFCIGIILCLSGGPGLSSEAQLGGLSEEELEALRERADAESALPNSGVEEPAPETQSYEGPLARDIPSRLEIFYSNRAGQPLLQFGYNTFGSGKSVTLRKAGGVQDNYIIGIGDLLQIDLRGQENKSLRLRVDNVGRVLLPKLDPIPAAGRQFGEFRSDLESQIASAYIATNVFVSIAEVRQISVIMSGEVNNPGPLTLSGLSSSVDAIALAGGIRKTGSLRNVTIHRGNDALPVDLYSILLGEAGGSNFSLMEGDRIHVAPLGPVVAVSGWVKRPGIYELESSTSAISHDLLIALAGGFEVRGRYTLSIFHVLDSGEVRVREVAGAKEALREGDLLLVEPNDERAQDAVHLEGHVRQSGTWSLRTTPSLKALLGDGRILGAAAYMPFAIVARVDPTTQLKTYIPFSPVEVVYGGADLKLEEEDVVHVFSIEEVRGISAALADEEDDDEDTEPDYLGIPGSELGARQLESLIDDRVGTIRRGEFDRVAGATAQGGMQDGELPETTARDLLKFGLREMGYGRRIDLSDQVLISLFRESRIKLFGAVKAPGDYFVMPGITLGQALEVAGGPSIQADLSSVEITSTQFQHLTGRSLTNRRSIPLNNKTLVETRLGPLDVVRVREVFSDRADGVMTVRGEVRYPGQFDLMRGERLSSVLQRAGGLTQSAYPYGAVFTRSSAARAEKEARDQLVDRMESQLATIVAARDVTGEGAAFLSELIVRLKEAPTLGRVSIEADPSVLVANSENDPILEPGDALFIPARPNSVTVVGEVLSPSSYQFFAGNSAKDYIELAGGYARFADKGRAFVIMPDGRARQLDERRWSFGDKMLAPGSIVVVPRNLRPFQWDEFLTSLTQISSQLALTAASVSVVVRDSN